MSDRIFPPPHRTPDHSRMQLFIADVYLMFRVLVYSYGVSVDLRDGFWVILYASWTIGGGSVAEWLACWTQAQKGPVSNRSRDAVG